MHCGNVQTLRSSVTTKWLWRRPIGNKERITITFAHESIPFNGYFENGHQTVKTSPSKAGPDEISISVVEFSVFHCANITRKGDKFSSPFPPSLNELIDINKSTYLKGGDSRTRGGLKFYQQSVTIDVYRNSFFPRTIMEWNTLPARVAEAGSVEDFRTGLQTTH
ncbi:unnamed protein product [Mytilus edulis]|uniref:Uncharacterized protein n=1 Tax=Mytilus edulis TaxID=6550 RepID=A0A8S3T9H6_MYTED|nr:unnamed protein product [Mytilus edulis]